MMAVEDALVEGENIDVKETENIVGLVDIGAQVGMANESFAGAIGAIPTEERRYGTQDGHHEFQHGCYRIANYTRVGFTSYGVGKSEA